MALYDKASLVLIPSGTKEGTIFSQKPTNGDGDLTFSRSTGATRVNADGLIEKERTNLLTYSNDFTNAVWIVIGTPTLTANYDTNPLTGANDAWRFVAAGTGDRRVQNINGSNSAFSLYVKGTGQIQIRDNSAAYLLNVTLTSSWQRVVVFIPAAFTGVQITGGSGGCDATIYAAQLEAGDIATDYIPTTTTAVSVGITDNVPRLDYTDSSCPSLLLEPQRTNLVTYSEQFDNAYWTKYAGATVTANTLTSPDGYTNADTLNTTSGQEIYANMGSKAASAITYTFSCFAKYNNAAIFKIVASDFTTSSTSGTFNLQTGEATLSQGATWSDTSVKMENYGNGWYRCIMTTTSPTTTGLYASLLSTNGSVYIYGMQCEQSAYATSYIPTYGTSVTRNADSASKTGVSSLIGQTEGTLFLEFDFQQINAGGYRIIAYLYNNSAPTSNRVRIEMEPTNKIWAVLNSSGVQTFLIQSNIQDAGNLKIAFAYKSGDSVLYINGLQVGTSSSTFSFSANLDSTSLVSYTGGNQSGNGVNEFILFQTRLSNEELEALTTL